MDMQYMGVDVHCDPCLSGRARVRARMRACLRVRVCAGRDAGSGVPWVGCIRQLRNLRTQVNNRCTFNGRTRATA